MNKHFSIFTVALLLTGTTSAFAASSTDLTVKGTIIPVACTPTLSASGIVDHGKMSAKDLKPDTATYLPETTLQLAVNCDAPILFALSPIDNRAGTGIAKTYFGLGLTNHGEKLGYFRVIPRNVMADNIVARAILSTDGGQTWLTEGSQQFWGTNNIWGVAATSDTSTPVAIKDLALDLVVRTAIAPTNSLTLTDEVQIDGFATLEVKYL
jgi:hypothetical protein